MPELITQSSLIAHRTPIEEINYTGEQIEPDKKDRKWLKRAGVAVVGYLAFLAVDNAMYYYDTARVAADDGEMLYDVEGCEPFPKVSTNGEMDELSYPPEITEEEAIATFDVEVSHKDTKSAASNFEPEKFNLFRAAEQWINIARYQQFSFTSEISGLEVNLYSDVNENPFDMSNIEETTKNMDEVIHASLNEEVDYAHVGIAAYIDCLRERFIDEDGPRELEGKSLNLYVPSKPGVCFSNGLVQEFPGGFENYDFCDSLAFTKKIRLSARPFYVYSQFWMAVMSNDTEPESVEHEITRLLVHEPSHLFLESVGMRELYDPNERLADEIENNVRDQLYKDGLPTTLRYPDDAYDDIED